MRGASRANPPIQIGSTRLRNAALAFGLWRLSRSTCSRPSRATSVPRYCGCSRNCRCWPGKPARVRSIVAARRDGESSQADTAVQLGRRFQGCRHPRHHDGPARSDACSSQDVHRPKENFGNSHGPNSDHVPARLSRSAIGEEQGLERSTAGVSAEHADALQDDVPASPWSARRRRSGSSCAQDVAWRVMASCGT